MKKLVSLVIVTMLCFSSLTFSGAVNNKDKSVNNGNQNFKSEKMYEISDFMDNISISNLTDDQVKYLNSISEKIIEEKTGIKVKATDGILYYDEEEANKSLQMRNDDASKIIEEKTGIKVEATDGILYYDITKGKDSELANNEQDANIQATSIPTELCKNYPYEHDWSGTENYSYSENFFRLDAPETYFSSYAYTPYHAEFYGIDGEYWFSVRGRERADGSYAASITLLEDLADYYNEIDYYIIMYNDASNSSAQNAYFALDRY